MVEPIQANVEHPRVVWLSSTDYTQTNSFRTLRDQIQDIVHIFHKSENVDDCERSIRRTHGHRQYEQIFLVVTIDYINQILQRDIHDVRVLQAILIFNQNSSECPFKFKQYPKVEGVYSNANELLMQLSSSVDNFSKESGILISTLKGCDVEMTTNIINNFADFSELWFPLFIDLLFDLPTLTDSDRAQDIERFAVQCQRFYADDRKMLGQIEQFLSSENRYSASNAVKCYTADCFLYRRVNKALRQQNFLAILDFLFFLIDMQAQLQTAYPEFSALYDPGDMLVFYRGQLMSQQELDLLNEKRRTGSLITVNSYLSTSMDQAVAERFIADSQNRGLMPVMFKIHAEYKDPTVTRRKPFAFIGHLSQYAGEEQEVLFSIGSFFRVDEIKFNKNDQKYEIQLKFIYDEEHLTITDDYGALKNCSLEEKILKTGDLLFNHIKHGPIKSHNFYQHFLNNTYPPIIKVTCKNGLGWFAFKQKEYDLAIIHQEQALETYKSFQNENCLNYLYVTSYCCLGAVYTQQKEHLKALSYYSKAQEIGTPIIPIDKYAFSNTFNHIPLVNIACIQKKQGTIGEAWATYKKLLATQMAKSTRFHGAVYLKIAEAGFSDDASSGLDKEQMKYWKRFLDHSLTDMSSTYRRSIVSGVLSINLRFANNEQNRDQIIDYYRKIINISQKFIKIGDEDYYIIIQCHQRISELYRKANNYKMSLEYDSNGLSLCRTDDIEFFTMFYESMTKTYEQQLDQLCSDSNVEDIDSQISLDLSPSSSSRYLWRTTSTCDTLVLHFERDEFAFGQCKKLLNNNLLQEPNLKRCLAYCLLKVAALRNEQRQTKSIRDLLHQVLKLIPDDEQIQFICNNNLAYLDENYDEIIQRYQTILEQSMDNARSLCIGEDAFCYIAHLCARKNDTDAEIEWYKKAIEYFEQLRFVCSHTRPCFNRVASFYQVKNDLSSCISIYLKLANHLVNYRNETSSLQKQVVLIVESLVQQSNVDSKDQINILKYLVQLILRPAEDINLIDTDFQWMINQYRKMDKQSWPVAHAYESYLDHILLHITHLLTPYIQTTLPVFRRVMTIYKFRNDAAGVFDVCQRFVEIILKYSMDRSRFIAMFKLIGLDLEAKERTAIVLDFYDSLMQFICTYSTGPTFQDYDPVMYILMRHEMCIERDREAAATIYRAMIHIVRTYREKCNRHLETNQYLTLLEKYYTELASLEPLAALDCYSNLIEIFLKLPLVNFPELLTRTFRTLLDRPKILLKLMTKYSYDYKPLIDEINRRLLNPNDQTLIRQPLPQVRFSYINNIVSSYAKNAERRRAFSKEENSIIECWTKCIYFLLEFSSEYDDYMASCHVKLNDPEGAARVFNHAVYRSFAVKYCPNACRRYLKYVSSQTETDEELAMLFVDHFHFVDGRREIRPLEPVKY